MDSVIVPYTFSQITSLGSIRRIAFRRGRNYLILKPSELTAKLSLNRSPKRLLLAPLDGNKREVGRLYRASIRSSKISFSSASVR